MSKAMQAAADAMGGGSVDGRGDATGTSGDGRGDATGTSGDGSVDATGTFGDGDEDATGTSGDGDGTSEDGDGAPKKGEPWTPEMQTAFDKRIAKEVLKRKELETGLSERDEELKELRDRAGAEDSELVLAAAEEAGVMPELLSAADARGLSELSKARRAAETLEDALEDQTGDMVELNGSEYPRKAVREKLREWRDKRPALERRYGGTRQKAQERALELWNLGRAAKKAGWDPKAKVPAKSDAAAETTERPKAARKADAPAAGGGSAAARPSGGKPEADWGSVDGTADLEAAIAAEEKRRGRGK